MCIRDRSGTASAAAAEPTPLDISKFRVVQIIDSNKTRPLNFTGGKIKLINDNDIFITVKTKNNTIVQYDGNNPKFTIDEAMPIYSDIKSSNGRILITSKYIQEQNQSDEFIINILYYGNYTTLTFVKKKG